MSFEVFEKLELKIQNIVDNVTLLQMEIEDLKEKNKNLVYKIQQIENNCEALLLENEKLKKIKFEWKERMRILLEKINSIQ